jgi:hypothetical protein
MHKPGCRARLQRSCPQNCVQIACVCFLRISSVTRTYAGRIFWVLRPQIPTPPFPFPFPFPFIVTPLLSIVRCAGLADVFLFSDHSIALIFRTERDHAIINDTAIRTTVFTAGGVAAARLSSHRAIAAAATSYHQAHRRSAALQTEQGIRKLALSKVQRQARQAEQLQQAQAFVAAAKAAKEAAATEKRLREASGLAFDHMKRQKSPKAFEYLVTAGVAPKPGVCKD